jgi:hypothetical protein
VCLLKINFIIKIKEKEDITIPSTYDFKSEGFVKNGDFWYFSKSILGITMKFMFDTKNRIFYFNKFYKYLPFEVAGLSTFGGFVSSLIVLELFLNKIFKLRGMALRYKNKNIGIIAPGHNGKTTFLIDLLKDNAKYVAEDHLIINFENNEIYPTCPFTKDHPWSKRSNRSELKDILKQAEVINTPVKLDKLYLIENSLNDDYIPKNKNIADFILLNGVYFLYDSFVRTYVFENKLSENIETVLHEIKNITFPYEYVMIRNFNFNKLSI